MCVNIKRILQTIHTHSTITLHKLAKDNNNVMLAHFTITG